MANTILKDEFNVLLKKIKKEKELLKTKINKVDCQEAAKKDNFHEKFMPIINTFQEDLVYISTQIYNVIQEIDNEVINMFSEIEKELDKLDVSDLENSEELVNTESIIEEELEGPNISSDVSYKE